MTPPPVAELARAHGVPVLQPESLDASAREAVAALGPELLVTAAYGRIFGPRFLALFSHGGINMHPSLLPRHRGPSPLQAAILAGDRETGVTVQALAPEMDSGDILLQQRVPLHGTESVAELHDNLGALGGRMVAEAVARIAAGTEERTPQDHTRATYCSKVARTDGDLTWGEDAATIDRMVRAYTPWPGVRTTWQGRTVQLTRVHVVTDTGGVAPAPPGTVVGVDSRRGILVQTTDNLVAIERLKLQARKEMDAQSFIHGNPTIVGSTLGQA
jgi:methionyl-tRNA formyltransferase